MNPCPCGWAWRPRRSRCRCTPEQIQRYRASCPGRCSTASTCTSPWRESTSLLPSSQAGESSAQVAARVSQARQRQLARQGCANAFLDLPGLQQHCRLPETDRLWLEQACERLNLSLRAAHRLLGVARTWPTWKAPVRSAARTWPRPCSTAQQRHLIQRNYQEQTSEKAIDLC